MAIFPTIAALFLVAVFAAAADTRHARPAPRSDDRPAQRLTLSVVGTAGLGGGGGPRVTASIAADFPVGWSPGAWPMPYATCTTCAVIGPGPPAAPHGVQFWRGVHQVGCELTCYLNIRALAQGPTERVDADGRVAFRQEFERQRPLGLVNEDGDSTSYREILTVVPLSPVEGLPPEAYVPAIFIDAFYRYGDAAGEVETRWALARLLATLELTGDGGAR